jgi:hypothetical protein
VRELQAHHRSDAGGTVLEGELVLAELKEVADERQARHGWN